jgi:hypothetical protein
MSDEPVLLEVDSGAAAIAYRAFEEWAGTAPITVFFEPEPIMAVDGPDCRGFLYDETYWVTLWASAGGERLIELLRDRSARADEPFLTVKDAAEEPDPERILGLVLGGGVPIDQVRHLI